MYQGKRISVAMAAYNGAEFIGEQLDSILNQSVLPDEIVISDDGSRDQTVEIATQYAAQYRDRITVTVLTDNPRHGIGGNFEWAISHCSGDYIFVCAQDDIWMPEKVQTVIDVFLALPDASMICHDLLCIDPNGQNLPAQQAACAFREMGKPGEAVFLPRNPWAERAVASPLVSGAVICFTAALAQRCLPIPCDSAEDQWLQFCAACDNGLYYLKQNLTLYRVHESASHSYRLSLRQRLKRLSSQMRGQSRQVHDYLTLSKGMRDYMDRYAPNTPELDSAHRTAGRLEEIGRLRAEALRCGRLKGSFKLIRLYLTDMRYRRDGAKNFIVQLLGILLVSKAKRKQDLGDLP